VVLGKLEQKTSSRICKVIVSCAVLHNLLILLDDSVLVGNTDPLRCEERSRSNEDLEDLERPVSHLQGKAKRDDLADAFINE
jgi:hypothetical protein